MINLLKPYIDDLSNKTNTLAYLCVLVVFGLAYFSTLRILPVQWNISESQATSHGFLGLACIIYIVYLRKNDFLRIEPKPELLAFFLLTFFSMLWFVGYITSINIIQFAFIPLILISAVMLCFGIKVLKLSFLPAMLLYSIFPVWEPIGLFLQKLTVKVTHFNLELIGRPVFVEDFFVHVQGGSFFIEPGCNGLRYFLVTITLSLISSAIYSLNLLKTILLIIFGTILALIANWIRVLTVVLVGDYTNMEHSLVHNHVNFGWVVYLFVVLIPFFVLSNKLLVNTTSPSTSVRSTTDKNIFADNKFKLAFVLTLVGLFSGPLSTYVLFNQTFALRTDSITLPLSTTPSTTPWSQATDIFNRSTNDWQPNFHNFTKYFSQLYTNGNDIVEMHVMYYANQSQDAELINVENTLVDNEYWTTVPDSGESISLDVQVLESFAVNSEIIETNRNTRKKIWYWYDIAGNQTISPIKAKLYQLTSLLNGRNDAALIVVAIDCQRNCDTANSTFNNFMLTMKNDIQNIL